MGDKLLFCKKAAKKGRAWMSAKSRGHPVYGVHSSWTSSRSTLESHILASLAIIVLTDVSKQVLADYWVLKWSMWARGSGWEKNLNLWSFHLMVYHWTFVAEVFPEDLVAKSSPGIFAHYCSCIVHKSPHTGADGCKTDCSFKSKACTTFLKCSVPGGAAFVPAAFRQVFYLPHSFYSNMCTSDLFCC